MRPDGHAARQIKTAAAVVHVGVRDVLDRQRVGAPRLALDAIATILSSLGVIVERGWQHAAPNSAFAALCNLRFDAATQENQRFGDVAAEACDVPGGGPVVVYCERIQAP